MDAKEIVKVLRNGGTIYNDEAADLIESLASALEAKEKERQEWQDDFNRLNEGGLKRIAELQADLEESKRRKLAAIEALFSLVRHTLEWRYTDEATIDRESSILVRAMIDGKVSDSPSMTPPAPDQTTADDGGKE